MKLERHMKGESNLDNEENLVFLNRERNTIVGPSFQKELYENYSDALINKPLKLMTKKRTKREFSEH